ncbi:hypothetical protein OH77DRAFT_243320 [Trametes cingulata]|nr:hypothetical protein OH77DRAFT_243320 [Trametes cingulata]
MRCRRQQLGVYQEQQERPCRWGRLGLSQIRQTRTQGDACEDGRQGSRTSTAGQVPQVTPAQAESKSKRQQDGEQHSAEQGRGGPRLAGSLPSGAQSYTRGGCFGGGRAGLLRDRAGTTEEAAALPQPAVSLWPSARIGRRGRRDVDAYRSPLRPIAPRILARPCAVQAGAAPTPALPPPAHLRPPRTSSLLAWERLCTAGRPASPSLLPPPRPAPAGLTGQSDSSTSLPRRYGTSTPIAADDPRPPAYPSSPHGALRTLGSTVS